LFDQSSQQNCGAAQWVTLDKIRLHDSLAQQSPVADNLIAPTAVFLRRRQRRQMARVIAAIERVCALPAWRETVLAAAPSIASADYGPRGVLMAYDFHLSEGVPKLIEINTNAGGALINTRVVSAQQHCCQLAAIAYPKNNVRDRDFVDTFIQDWRQQRGAEKLNTIAIVDTAPEQQFLFSEFLMFQRQFELAGITSIITDPQDLQYCGDNLMIGDRIVDMVYNRSTDFYFEHPESATLRQAYQRNRVVVSPNPHLHAIYANKLNLALLSSESALRSLGASASDIDLLVQSIPATTEVVAHNADSLWQQRKKLFFKPIDGYGSKAVYRGDKITRKVWQSVLRQRYVAQQLVPPDSVAAGVDGTEMKADYRNYSYNSRVQLVTARLYQGQTTNMRTNGGGFAPVISGRLPVDCCS